MGFDNAQAGWAARPFALLDSSLPSEIIPLKPVLVLDHTCACSTTRVLALLVFQISAKKTQTDFGNILCTFVAALSG